MRFLRTAAIIAYGLALALLLVMVWGFVVSNNYWYFLYLPAVVIWIYNGLKIWRTDHAHRRARRNSRSARSHPSTGGSTSYYTPYTPYTRAIVAGTIGASEGTSLRRVEEPFRAWKWAHLMADYPDKDGRLVFLPMNTCFPPYKVEDVAVCAKIIDEIYGRRERDLHTHTPAEFCSCGFYGLKTREMGEGLVSFPMFGQGTGVLSVMLEVEFYGRVIVHTDGYRAEKQRVLAVHAPDNTATRLWYASHPQPEVEWNWFYQKEEHKW